MIPKELVDIVTEVPSVELDIRYATASSFTGVQQYAIAHAWLRPEPLAQLSIIVSKLAHTGHQLVIFDAFRSVYVQNQLRQVLADDNYVATISNHSRGITVDASVKGLDMGTEYDDFTEKAHAHSSLITKNQAQNRALLRNIMAEHGFVQHKYEWWHFDYMPTQEWSIIDCNYDAYKKVV